MLEIADMELVLPQLSKLSLESLIRFLQMRTNRTWSCKVHVNLRDSPSSRLERSNSTPNSREESGLDSSSAELGRRVGVPPNRKSERGVSVPPIVKQEKPITIPSNVKHDRRNGASTTTVSVVTDEIKVDENGNAAENDVASTSNDDASVPREVLDSNMNDDIKPSDARDANGKHLNGVCNDGHGSRNVESGPVGQINVAKSVAFNLQQDGDVDDFVEQHDSMSAKSIGENEGNVAVERSWNSTTPMTEFYDAWEELSSESGPQHLMPDIETELREIRLSLLMEIEKRKQAEETLTNMRSQWQRIREQLSLVGLTLPVDPTTLSEGEQPADAAAEICQQVHLVRFVSFSIGRGAAKAEVETETEAQVKLKNSEIARLWDRLHYYEAVNQEMSQRNQELNGKTTQAKKEEKTEMGVGIYCCGSDTWFSCLSVFLLP
ncbi:UNVERIFIED_CONTAM: hypothetical protein Scaly_2192000 [Sesamum calycinum]|uniref:Uncharacterized protein n=1 Tax=Sesamum calycinum TaxID=2727403 RepID=A0AAW2MQ53_9LAMI